MPILAGPELDILLPGTSWVGGHRVREARVRSVDGHDELALELTGAIGEERITELLDRCVAYPNGPERVASGALTVGDRTALVLHVRRLTFGPILDLVIACQECGELLDAGVPLSSLFAPPAEDSAPDHALVLPGGTMQLRLPTGDDLLGVRDLAVDDAAGALLARCVQGGAEPELGEDARTAVGDAMARLDPQAELLLAISCAVCGAGGVVDLDVGSLLLGELGERAAEHELAVHLFALHYHWRENDTLALPVGRRRRYLEWLVDRGVGQLA